MNVAHSHPRVLAEVLAAEHVHIFATTPAVLELLLRVPGLDSKDWTSLQVLGIGGAPLPKSLADRARGRLKAVIVSAYGAVEFGGPVALGVFDENSVDGEIGHPLPEWELAIHDPDGGMVVAPGNLGELVACRRGSPSDSWLRSGDLARKLPNGRYQVVGRLDDVLSRGGRRVHPARLEGIIEMHPDVVQAAAVGVPSRHAGHDALIAFIVPSSAGGVDTDDLRTYCRAKLPSHEVPDHMVLCEAVPATRDGKIQREALRAVAIEALRTRTTARSPASVDEQQLGAC